MGWIAQAASGEKIWPTEPLRGINTKLVLKQNQNASSASSYISEDTFKRLSEWKVNLIRVALNVDEGSPWYAPKGQKKVSPPPLPTDDRLAPYRKHLEGLKTALAFAEKYRIYVIPTAGNIVGRNIDVTYQKSAGTGFEETLLDLWKYVAKEHGKNPWLLGYDLLNEPHTDLELKTWQTVTLPALIREIRAIDSDTYLVVEPGPWGMPTGFSSFQPIRDPKVVYSFHFYAPQNYTHQGVHASRLHTKGKLTYPGTLQMFDTSPKESWNRDRLIEYCRPAREFQKKYHVRMWVGEFSVIRWAPGRDKWLTDAISIFENYGWDWCFHSYAGWNGWNPTFDADDPVNNTTHGGKNTERLRILQAAWMKNTLPSLTSQP
jgi:hypothetical protein